MPGFNGSGTFVRTYDWTDDKANTVKVTASRMDAEDDGFATGLSTVICKDGQTTTTAAIPFAQGVKVNDGTAAAPALFFTADTDNGIYRIGTNNIGIAAGGAKVVDIGTSTVAFTGAVTVANNAAAYSCRVYNDASISLGAASETPATAILTFNSETFDNGSLHATASNSGRITVPVAGVYVISASVRITSVLPGDSDEFHDYSAAIKLNGTSYLAQAGGSILDVNEVSGATVAVPVNVHTIATLAANDYVEIEIGHEFQATASATFVSGISPVFSAARLF